MLGQKIKKLYRSILLCKHQLKNFFKMLADTHSRGMKNKMNCLYSFQVPNPADMIITHTCNFLALSETKHQTNKEI